MRREHEGRAPRCRAAGQRTTAPPLLPRARSLEAQQRGVAAPPALATAAAAQQQLLQLLPGDAVA